MKYLPSEINDRIVSVLEQKFSNVLVESIDKQIEFFNSVTDLREAFPDYDENSLIVSTENAWKICDNVRILIDQHYQRDESLSFTTQFPGLSDELNQLFEDINTTLEVEQLPERYTVLSTDKFLIKSAKSIKKSALKIQHTGLKAANFFRIKFKKEPYKIKYWNQTIPLKNVALLYLRNRLLSELKQLYEDVHREISLNSIAFWNYDERFDADYISNFSKQKRNVEENFESPDTITTELESYKDKIYNSLKILVGKSFEEYEKNCDKVGTVESNNSIFKNKEIEQQFNKIINEFDTVIKEWNNNHYSLGEDWELNCDLESIRYSAIDVYLKFNKSLAVKNKLQIYPHFSEISSALKSVNTNIDKPISDLQEIERLLVLARDSMQKVLLTSTIPNLISSISDLKLQEMISEAKRSVKNQIRFIEENRIFVETADYNKRIRSSEMDEIHPRDFISFNTLPSFLESLDQIKQKSSAELKALQSELINLGNMVDFSLESAITGAIKDKFSLSETKDIALDGIKMSRDKNDELLVSFNSICENVLADLRRSVATYCEELFDLTQSSKIIEINVQLAKAKAKAKVQEARNKLFLSIRNYLPKILNKVSAYTKKIFSYYIEARKQIGLTESKETIASDISDFLSKANSSLKKLPYIYQRLFQLTPLENKRLYVSREFEDEQLKTAYKKWLEGGYAPVIIAAEKGAGTTSFINIFRIDLENEINSKRLIVNPTVTSEEDFLKLLQDLYLPERFLNYEDFLKYLNLPENKQIIFIENLQHLYLRSSKGFLPLKLLVDIISKTNKNIFWVASSTLYANDYLSKTIRLNDVFGYQIFFKQLKNDQIIDLIKKRNSISGYSIVYEIDPELARRKEINKLNFAQQQNILEKQFFNSLNEFAQSNISLALLFWLRSITGIKERQIFINADFQISDTILKSLSAEKVFILQSLLLHDGLMVPELSKTINLSLKETREIVQILFDDGVLIRKNEVYLINPLLYRQSVILLKSKNLI